MAVTMWILFICFGLLSLYYWKGFLSPKVHLSWFAALIWIFSMFVTAITAGVLFGGLKLFGMGV